MLDTGHPTSATNRMVLTMMAPSVAPDLAPGPLSPATMLPPLTETQGFAKLLVNVPVILHAKRWNGITTQHTESPADRSLSSELYMLLINYLDGDMIEPNIQGGPSSFANEGIFMLHKLIYTHQSPPSA
jgi:hypothetical protein